MIKYKYTTMSKVSIRPFLNTEIKPKNIEGTDFYPLYFQIIHKRITSKLKIQGLLADKTDPLNLTPELNKEATKIKTIFRILENNIIDFNLRASKPTLGNWNNVFDSCLYVILQQTGYFHFTDRINLRNEIVEVINDKFKNEIRDYKITTGLFSEIIRIDLYTTSRADELIHFVKDEHNIYIIKKMQFANYLFANYEKYSLFGYLTNKGIIKDAVKYTLLEENTIKEFVSLTNEHLKKVLNKYYNNSNALKSDMEYWGETEDD